MLVDVKCDVAECANNKNGDCTSVNIVILQNRECSGFVFKSTGKENHAR